jgi:hypothetical protein
MKICATVRRRAVHAPIRQFLFGTVVHTFHRISTGLELRPLYLVVFILDDTGASPHNVGEFGCVIGIFR